ncbi:MAG: hypothetical protein HZA36_03425 [Parcubacteria group bacterium]|nr:hypothetical protein [Parcubacteria group bacterium]
MRTAVEVREAVHRTFLLHTDFAKKPSKAVRKWDSKTPYAVHPTWCGLTILCEEKIAEEDRYDYAEALFYHDILEDTNASLPPCVSDRVRELVEGMTFMGGSVEEMERVWERGNEIILLKLYDKVSNLMDSDWMPKEKKDKYIAYTRKLLTIVKREYGGLNITKIAEAMC